MASVNTLPYFKRTNDVAILHGVTPGLGKAVRVNLSEDEICTGVQKLAQAVMIELFTEKGSDPFDVSRGTTFMLDAKRGRLINDTEAAIRFYQAATDILTRFRASENTEPDDEKLRSLDLLGISFAGDRLTLSVKITTADPARQVILPIPIPML